MFIHDLILLSLKHRSFISSDGSLLNFFKPTITSQARLSNSGTYTCKVCYDQMQPFLPTLRKCVNSSSTVYTIGQKIYLHNILAKNVSLCVIIMFLNVLYQTANKRICKRYHSKDLGLRVISFLNSRG